MNVKILTLKEKAEWNKLIAKLPIEQQDVYYTPEYYSLYENYGDGKAQCFVFEMDDQLALYPFLINSINELGYDLDNNYYDIQGAYGYNGVISSSYDNAFRKAFYKAFNDYCMKENIIAEFTRFHPLLSNNIFSTDYMNIIFDRRTVFIDLSKSEEKLFASFQRSTRKQIKRGKTRYELEIIVLKGDLSYLDSFIRIYWETMKRVHSIDYLFFTKSFFKELLERDNTYQFIALYQGKPIALITAIEQSDYMHGHLGGALTNYLHVSAYSSLYWEMIRTAKRIGKKFLHVGGGATSQENDNLLFFKKNFSNDLADFYIGKKIHNEKTYSEVVIQWKEKYPNLYENNKNRLLGYREI